MSQDEADLGDHVTITLEVVAAETGVEVVDTLPPELRYIPGTLVCSGGTATCAGSDHEITCTLDENVPYTISFDAQVTSAEADDNTVTNTATAGDAEAEAELTIHPYEGFTKEVIDWSGTEDPYYVPMYTDVHWRVQIVVSNITGDAIATMQDVVVKDNLGGDLELHDASHTWGQDPFTVLPNGTITSKQTGKTKKEHLTWDGIQDLDNVGGFADMAAAWLDISTDVNPGQGKKVAPVNEYTEDGEHELNSGAVVKFFDVDGTGFQLSAHTPPITVVAYDPTP